MTQVTACIREVGYKAPNSNGAPRHTLMEPTMTRTIALAAAVLALSFGAAHAQQASVRINPAKLNLNNVADAKILYRQLADAAAEVCGGYPSHIGDMGLFERCYRPTLDAAVASAHAPLVTAARDGVMPRIASR